MSLTLPWPTTNNNPSHVPLPVQKVQLPCKRSANHVVKTSELRDILAYSVTMRTIRTVKLPSERWLGAGSSVTIFRPIQPHTTGNDR